MNRTLGFCIAALIVLNARLASCATIMDGPIVDPANGLSYYLLTSDTWTASQTEAVKLGGTLAVIHNQAENTWIFNTFAPLVQTPVGDLWIGLFDPDTGDAPGAKHTADFVWADEEPVTYTNWSAGEPNDDPARGGAYYAAIAGSAHDGLTAGEWNDKTNAGSATIAFGVVEVPEPMMAGVWGAGLMIAATRWRWRRPVLHLET